MALLELVERDTPLKRTATTGGGEYTGPCPWCGGRDRFHVWPEKGNFWCRGCNRKGDTIQYLRDFRGLSFREACKVVGKELDVASIPSPVNTEEREIIGHIIDAYQAWSRAEMIERTDYYRHLSDELEIAEIAYHACCRRPDLYPDDEFDYWSTFLGDLYHERARLEDDLDVLTYTRREEERFVWWEKVNGGNGL